MIYRAYTGEISVDTPMAVLRERATADSGHGQPAHSGTTSQIISL